MIKPKLIKQFLVEPGTDVNLKDYVTDWTETDEAKELGTDVIKERAAQILEENRKHLDSAEELDHNFLWRYMKALPERGRIGIFNRSYYEDVLVVKVHPEWLGPGQPADPDNSFWEKRYEDINNFEKHLSRNGTLVLKFFLHVSKDEQKRRFLERLTNTEKHWKFSGADLEEREHWKSYQKAFADAISATSTKRAPWYVIPADRKYVARALVADIIAAAIQGLKLEFPKVSPEKMAMLDAAREKLEGKNKDQKEQP
jgi:PPK2 family polyphosphate:nucleotide phosphotransferase